MSQKPNSDTNRRHLCSGCRPTTRRHQRKKGGATREAPTIHERQLENNSNPQKIIEKHVPNLNEELKEQLINFVHNLRNLDLKKLPSISETIDWAKVILLTNVDTLDNELVRSTLNVLLKFQDDIDFVTTELPSLTKGPKI